MRFVRRFLAFRSSQSSPSVAAEQHTSFLAGFETEFILLKSTDPIEPVDHHDYSTASSLYADSVTSKVLAEIASSLQHGGVELQLYHAEAAPGQFEIVTGPLSPLEAADALVFTRETIKNIAHKHGLRATLAPRVFGNTCMVSPLFRPLVFFFLKLKQVEAPHTLMSLSIPPMTDLGPISPPH